MKRYLILLLALGVLLLSACNATQDASSTAEEDTLPETEQTATEDTEETEDSEASAESDADTSEVGTDADTSGENTDADNQGGETQDTEDESTLPIEEVDPPDTSSLISDDKKVNDQLPTVDDDKPDYELPVEPPPETVTEGTGDEAD